MNKLSKKLMKEKVCLISLLVITIICVCSCGKDEITNSYGSLSFFDIGNGSDGDLLSGFDKPNLIGLVTLESRYRDEYDFESGGTGDYTHYAGNSFYLDAEFSNAQKNKYASLSPATIVVNAFQMQEYDTGKYYVPSHLDIEHYFGYGYNKIVIDSNQYFNKVIDSVTFANTVHITNVSVGQVVDRNQNFVINFTGATNNSVVEWEIMREVFFEQPDDTTNSIRSSGLYNMGWNTGQVTITPDIFEHLKNGWYSLTITTYEPKYIALSTGKEILMLGLSSHTITIKIEE